MNIYHVENLKPQLSVSVSDVQEYGKLAENTTVDRDQIITDFLDGAGI